MMLTTYDALSEEPGDFTIFARFSVGSTGAIGTIKRCSDHFVKASFSRTATGTYKLPLDGAFVKNAAGHSPLLDHSVKVIGTISTTDGVLGFVTVDNTANQDASGTSYVTIQFHRMDTGAAADVASGNEVSVALRLKTDLP